MRFGNGPGRVGRTTEIAGFDLGDDEGFGEETAALYDAQTNYVLVQYNHHGVRASAIKKYFNVINHTPAGVTGYELSIKLDPTAEIKLAQKNFINKIHYKIVTSRLTEAHRVAGLSLHEALAMSEEQRGGSIEVTISAPKRENLLMSSVKKTVNALRGMATADQEEETNVLTQFEIEGRDGILDRADAVDMLSPKLVSTVDGLTLGGDRRYTRRSRWDGLLRARHGWRTIIE